MKIVSSWQYQQWDEKVIKALKRLGSLQVEYPAELLAARRAAFVRQVEQEEIQALDSEQIAEETFIKCLDDLKSVNVEYPPALLAARRAEMVDRIKQYSNAEVEEELYPRDQEIIGLLKRLKSVEAEYPAGLLAARRTAFQRQAALGGGSSILEGLRAAIRNLFNVRASSLPGMNGLRTSLVVLAMMFATFAAFLSAKPLPASEPAPASNGVFQPGPIAGVTNTAEVVQVICKPGYLPPLCLAKEFDKSQDLTFSGNGSARPAVAKDTLPGFNGVHKPSYVNDGLYGPGASWISNSPNSWIKIDLGKATTINTIEFGRDRLGRFNDRDPGKFVIAVALNDNIYADGNSNNDHIEYIEIYNSDQIGFDGTVAGPETVRAQFGAVTARFVKITFANAGTAVDEVEAFLITPTIRGDYPTKESNDDLGLPPTSIPNIAAWTNTAPPPPTATSVPPNTATSVPTNPPPPTNTPAPPPTNTPEPPPPNTSVPPTEIVVPTNEPPTSQAPTGIIEQSFAPTDMSITPVEP